jgi:hypothetical protein
MTTPLDDAINTAAKAEATYLADLGNVGAIQAAIDTATNPLAPAQAQLATDTGSYKQTLLNLAKVATDQANALP